MDTRVLREYLTGITEVSLADVTNEAGLSLIGILLTQLLAPGKRPEKAADAIELLSTEYKVIPTFADMQIWSGLKKQEEMPSYI